MATYDLMRRIDRLEKDVERKIGDDLEQAFEDTHHDVHVAMRFKLLVLLAERDHQQSTGEEVLDREARAIAAKNLRQENALFLSMPRDEYMAGLPRHYVCGKCGTTVGIDIERMMRFDAKLPACHCSIDNGLINRVALESLNARR
jgi:hypothetical protein